MENKNRETRIFAEEIEKILGGCAGCGWRRAVMVKGTAQNKQIVVKIACKAVQNATVHVAPMTTLENYNECPKRLRAEEKRQRDEEYRNTQAVMAYG